MPHSIPRPCQSKGAHAPDVESGPMPFRDMQRIALTLTIGAAITLGPALDAGQTGVPSVQYQSPEGVEYRSLPDTDAVKSARAALEADPRNITRIIDLGVAQSGARQFREAIATFTPWARNESDMANATLTQTISADTVGISNAVLADFRHPGLEVVGSRLAASLGTGCPAAGKCATQC